MTPRGEHRPDNHRSTDTSIGHFLGQFEASAKTRELYALHLTQYSNWCQERGIDAVNVTPGQIYDYQDHLRQEGRKESTVWNKTAALKAYYRWLTDVDVIPSNPTERLRSRRVEHGPRRYLSIDEIARLLDVSLNDKNWSLIALLTFNSLRVTELTSCNVESLDTSHTPARLNFTPYRQDRLPYTVIAPEVLERLMAQLDGRTNGPLFLNTRGDRMNRGNAGSIVAEASKRAGFDPPLNAQMLAYTLPGMALEHGFSYLSVLKAAGVVHPSNARRWLHHTERLPGLNAPTRLARLVLNPADDPFVLLSHAEALLEETDAPEAFAIACAGAVLENHLRQLSIARKIPIPEELGRQSIYGFATRLRRDEHIRNADMRTFERVSDIRNDAAHGRFDLLTRELATSTLRQIRELLTSYPL